MRLPKRITFGPGSYPGSTRVGGEREANPTVLRQPPRKGESRRSSPPSTTNGPTEFSHHPKGPKPMTRYTHCLHCDGNGYEPSDNFRVCHRCLGAGGFCKPTKPEPS